MHALAQAVALLVASPLPPAVAQRMSTLPDRLVRLTRNASDVVPAEPVGFVLADLAEVIETQHQRLVETTRLAGQLQQALDSRVVIEQAKGIVAGRAGVAVDTAFAELRDYARRNNMKLHDVCRQVVTGRLGVDKLSRQRR